MTVDYKQVTIDELPGVEVPEPAEQIEVHPVAALFPMMTEDELNDLAADIQANGLVHAIVLDENGLLIDGRNRLEACHRACVEPRFTTLPKGQDPVAFILSCNVNRRHLNKGQAAMAVARAEVLAPKKHDGNKGRAALAAGTSRARVSQAILVLEYAPEFADAVLAGFKPLDEAYEEARYRKMEAEGAEKKRAAMQAEEKRQFDLLQSAAPDLATLVQEERLALNEALQALEERRRKEEEEVRMVSSQVHQALSLLDPGTMDAETWAQHKVRCLSDPRSGLRDEQFSGERVRRIASALIAYVKLLGG